MKSKDTRTAPPVVRVRRANEFDLEAWAALRAAHGFAESGEDHASGLAAMLADSPRRAVWLAIDREGIAAGFAEVRLRDIADGCASSPVAYLECWYVLSELRGQGIGHALLDAVITWSRAQGCTELASGAELDNLIARAAHEALGFEKVRTVVNYKRNI